LALFQRPIITFNCLAACYRIVGFRSLNEHRHRPLSAELALGALEPDVLLDDFETVARQLISVADREISVDPPLFAAKVPSAAILAFVRP